MPAAKRPKQIDTLMEQASKALAKTDYFKAERVAANALVIARQANDFDRMARIIMPLQEARRQRLQIALEVGEITIIDEPLDEEPSVETGCYLVRPPQVGADARRMRLAGLEQEVPVAVVCREPLTQIKLCPIVAIGPGVTIRAKVDPPDDDDEIDMAWFVDAMEALGDAAIESVDPGLATLKRLDALMGRLDAIPDHENLHQALEEVCREAAVEFADQELPKPTAPARTRSRSGNARQSTRSTKAKADS